MITLKDIEKEYGKRIPAKFRRGLEKIESEPHFQQLIELTLKYNQTGNEKIYHLINDVCKKKMWVYNWKNGAGYNMYYLCFIFMHPLTKMEVLACKCDKLMKANGIKFRWI